MVSFLVRISLLLTIVVACGRELVGPFPRDFAISTDRDEYRLVGQGQFRETHILATYTNTTGSTVYLDPCWPGPMFELEQSTPVGWLRAYIPVCPEIGASAIAVAPGESREDEIPVFDCGGWNCGPKLKGRLPGVYRILYSVHASAPIVADLQEPLPLEARLSNSFVIRD